MNHHKTTSMKVEVKKLLYIGFISLVPLRVWISNPILVNKKKIMISVCVDYRNLNLACPKDNYLIASIVQIIGSCTWSAILCFMDGFSGYNNRKSNQNIKRITLSKIDLGKDPKLIELNGGGFGHAVLCPMVLCPWISCNGPFKRLWQTLLY